MLRLLAESDILWLHLGRPLESEHLLLRDKVVDNRLRLLLLLCEIGEALDGLSWCFEALDGLALYRLLRLLNRVWFDIENLNDLV